MSSVYEAIIHTGPWEVRLAAAYFSVGLRSSGVQCGGTVLPGVDRGRVDGECASPLPRSPPGLLPDGSGWEGFSQRPLQSSLSGEDEAEDRSVV